MEPVDLGKQIDRYEVEAHRIRFMHPRGGINSSEGKEFLVMVAKVKKETEQVLKNLGESRSEEGKAYRDRLNAILSGLKEYSEGEAGGPRSSSSQKPRVERVVRRAFGGEKESPVRDRGQRGGGWLAGALAMGSVALLYLKGGGTSGSSSLVVGGNAIPAHPSSGTNVTNVTNVLRPTTEPGQTNATGLITTEQSDYVMKSLGISPKKDKVDQLMKAWDEELLKRATQAKEVTPTEVKQYEAELDKIEENLKKVQSLLGRGLTLDDFIDSEKKMTAVEALASSLVELNEIFTVLSPRLERQKELLQGLYDRAFYANATIAAIRMNSEESQPNPYWMGTKAFIERNFPFFFRK